MRGYVSRVITPEEVASLTNEQLCEQIEQGLYVDDVAAGGVYRHKRPAEYMERAFYVCPHCGLTSFVTKGDRITCCRCHASARYLPTLRFEGIEQPWPFETTTAWYAYQSDFVNAMDLREHTEAPLFTDTADFSEVIVYRNKNLLQKNAAIALYGDRLTVGDRVLSFADISAVAAVGRNKVNLYIGKEVFQLKGDKHFNGLKYVHLYYRYKNIEKGDFDGKFLGL